MARSQTVQHWICFVAAARVSSDDQRQLVFQSYFVAVAAARVASDDQPKMQLWPDPGLGSYLDVCED